MSSSVNKSLPAKKAGNILNKPRGDSASSGATSSSAGGGNFASGNNNEASEGGPPAAVLSEKDLRTIQDEIRKLKAIIVKQENRIRALEAKEDARNKNGSDAAPASAGAATSDGKASESANDHASTSAGTSKDED